MNLKDKNENRIEELRNIKRRRIKEMKYWKIKNRRKEENKKYGIMVY